MNAGSVRTWAFSNFSKDFSTSSHLTDKPSPKGFTVMEAVGMSALGSEGVARSFGGCHKC